MVATTELSHPRLPLASSPPKLDRYVLRREIGRGGMGTVYEAWDSRVQCEVALKVIAQTDDTRDAEVRLMREARAMASLGHPNVVAVRDVGSCDGVFFVVMQLVRGTTLRTWAARTAPGFDAKLRALIAAGRGLVAIHSAGLVHRDIKPDNILVGDDGHVRVSDLGIARKISTRTLDETRLTAAGGLVGTPAYMAPEQLRDLPPTPAADQFSFCVTALELLGDDALPRELSRALHRGLSFAPEDRFRTLAELLVELESIRRRVARAAAPQVPSRRRWWLGALIVALGASTSLAMTPSRTSEATALALALAAPEELSTSTRGVTADEVVRGAAPRAPVHHRARVAPPAPVAAYAPTKQDLIERLHRVEQPAWDRAFLYGDVPGFTEAHQEALQAIKAGDSAALERVLAEIPSRIDAVRVDPAYIEAKIERLRAGLAVSTREPDQAARIEAYFTGARRIANAEHDPMRANHVLSNAWQSFAGR